jgi:hypothetical protein
MTLHLKDWLAVAVSSLFAYVVFGSISSKAGYPRWHGLIMAIPLLNLVALMVFAFSTWPIESELLQSRLGGSGSTPREPTG